MDANTYSTANRSAVRTGAVETSSGTIIGVGKPVTADSKQFVSVSGVRHGIEVGDHAFDYLAMSLLKGTRQAPIIKEGKNKAECCQQDGEAEKEVRDEPDEPGWEAAAKEHEQSADGNEQQAKSGSRPLAVSAFDNIKDDGVIHGSVARPNW